VAWPDSADALVLEQEQLARAAQPLWHGTARPLAIAGCFVSFARDTTGPPARRSRLGRVGPDQER
jgi:hypothetical protein